jgi:hypothetical protein
LFLKVLEEERQRYQFVVVGYVVMPEHFHLLISEPEKDIRRAGGPHKRGCPIQSRPLRGVAMQPGILSLALVSKSAMRSMANRHHRSHLRVSKVLSKINLFQI